MTNKNEPVTKPSRKLVDFTFWAAHVALVAFAFLFIAGLGGSNSMPYWWIPLLIAFISFSAYCFAIGSYAKQMGKSAMVWGVGSLLFSPFSVWVSYVASFYLKPAVEFL